MKNFVICSRKMAKQEIILECKWENINKPHIETRITKGRIDVSYIMNGYIWLSNLSSGERVVLNILTLLLET